MCDKVGVCETEKQHEIELVEKEQKFCASKFFIGVLKLATSMAFVAYGLYTILWFRLLWIAFKKPTAELAIILQAPLMLAMGIGWAACTFALALGLGKALGTMIGNAKINAEIKAGINKIIELKGSADAAQIVGAVKNGGGKNEN
jgi:hypothetical protein